MASNDPARAALSDRVRSLRLSGREPASAPRARALPWVFSFVLLLTTLAFGYRAYRVGSLPSPDAGSAETKAPVSASAAPTSSVASTGEVVLQSKGYVIPISQVQVSPKVGGQLVWINPRFEEGVWFNAGEVLARIERDDYASDFNQAKFALDAATERFEEVKKTMPEEIKQAEAELEENRSMGTQQKLELDRNRRLVAGSAIAQREMEQAKYGYDATMARVKKLEATLRMIKDGRFEKRVKTAEAEMRQAKAFYDKAKWRLDNTEIRAPVSGNILTKKAEQGNVVNPSAFSSGISASLCDMANLKELEIDLSVQERDIANVKRGQVCTVMPDAYKDDKEFLAKHPRGYAGQVSRLMPTADRAKGAVPVRVRIGKGEISDDEAGKYLRPDLSATVSFLRGDTTSPPSVSDEPAGSSRRDKPGGSSSTIAPEKASQPRPEEKR